MTAAVRGLRPAASIGRKRDGHELTHEELAAFVGGYLDGSVSEGQMGAMLMAGVLRGFSEAEAFALTEILAQSGEQLDLSGLAGPTVDKHSTGGVADGTTLLVAPLLACCGATVVKLSGRGLGHTGGTLDKLEAIPGMNVALDHAEMLRVAGEVGCVVAGQTERLVPADRALYALRDVTGTVESPALIASSVMSKKLAAGAGTIVLDVKAGDGAFMAGEDEAGALAELCVSIGERAGRRCSALVTAMDEPLGHAVGGALEVAEVVELLSAPPSGRLAEVALALATEALVSARSMSPSEAHEALVRCWTSGDALDRLGHMIEEQGGDARVCADPRAVLPAAPVAREVPAPAGGAVTSAPARAIGEVAADLGSGRAHKGDRVDPAVGVEMRVEVGDVVAAGAAIAVVHARDEEAAERAASRLAHLVTLGEEAPVRRCPVRRHVRSGRAGNGPPSR